MSESWEIIAEKDGCNDEGNFDDFANINPHEESTILHTKKLHIGSSNIIGKGLFKVSLRVSVRLPR